MALAFDSGRTLRLADMPDLIEAVYNADQSDEFDWLEWKSALDLATKHAWSHIARAVLGPANRMPNDGAAAVGGYAYLLVGVEPGSVAGVVPVDSAELDRGVCAYTGTADGPRWRAFYVGYGGKQVLVVEISPPVWGDPLFTAHKEGDRLKDGDILVRRPGSTRQATSAEVALLVQRAARRSAALDVVVSAEDETVVPRVDASQEAQVARLDRPRREAARRYEVRRFLAIEGHASLCAAAESLGGIDQPTLHRQIVVLERDTGLELFRRQGSRRTLIYSTSGHKLAAEAHKALEVIDNVETGKTHHARTSEAIVRLRPTPAPHPE